jgi:biotin/methionine sulfoxide reductase
MQWLELLYGRWQDRAAHLGITMPSFAAFWEAGHVEVPERPLPGPYLSEFRADPVAHKLATPSGKIEIFSETIASFGYAETPGHPIWQEPAEWLGGALARRFPLHMISNQPRTRLHSQYDNGVVSQASKVQGREPVWINPQDAAARDIADGDVVRLYNQRGACLAGAVVTDRVMPGVVQLATGAWYSPLQGSERLGNNSLPLCVHGNPNALTRDQGSSRLAQGSAAQTCLVDVEKFTGDLPPVGVMQPPEILTKVD